MLGTTHHNTHAHVCAHSGLFVKTSVEVSICWASTY